MRRRCCPSDPRTMPPSAASRTAATRRGKNDDRRTPGSGAARRQRHDPRWPALRGYPRIPGRSIQGGRRGQRAADNHLQSLGKTQGDDHRGGHKVTIGIFGLAQILAILVLILAIVFIVIGSLSSLAGGLIAALALAVALIPRGGEPWPGTGRPGP